MNIPTSAPMTRNSDFSSSADALFLWEVTDGNFLTRDLSHPFAELLASPREALVGALMAETVAAVAAGPLLVLGHHCLRSGTMVTERVELELPRGRHSCHCLLLPLRNATGAIERIFGMLYDRALPDSQPGDLSSQQRAEKERQEHLRFLEAMDAVNRAMQGTIDLKAMLSAVLDTVLDLFQCDRASLLFPCDPDSPTWLVPEERTRPQYPSILVQRDEMAMPPPVAKSLRLLLGADGPLTFARGTKQQPLAEELCTLYGANSLLATAIFPLVGKPWQFIVHQCSSARIWTGAEKRLLQEIGRRLADGLSTLLASRDLRESEALHRSLVTAMAEGVIYQVADSTIIAVNPAAETIFRLPASAMRGRTPAELPCQTIHEDGSPFPSGDHPAMVTLRTGQPQTDVTMGIQRKDKGITWCAVNSQPLLPPGSSRPYAVVTTLHDISDLKQTQIRLQRQTAELSEANSALKVLLQHNQQAEAEIKKMCLANIETLILPYLDQLGSSTLSPEGRTCLKVIRKNMQGLALSSMNKLSASSLGLTPREVMVADLIRKDYTSKDIADLLCLSAGTVESYRDQIREKLGIKNQKVNLRNYLRHHFNE